jgi:flagellar protein FlbD
VIKLTRLNHQVLALNPDHIVAAEASPDTTLVLLGGDKLLVRESLDELIERVIEYRRAVRSPFEALAGPRDGDPPIVVDAHAHASVHACTCSERPHPTSSLPPHGGR